MPYQASRKKSLRSSSAPDEDGAGGAPPDAAETEEHAHGADLLLSLTKKSRMHRLVTPPDGVGSNDTTVEENKSSGDMESAFASAPSDQRVLHHSPIKCGAGVAKKPRSDVLLSTELAPYAMVPAWSSSVYNGPPYPYASAFPRRPDHTNASCPRAEEKKEDDGGKQRLISPSSSNEKLDEEVPVHEPPRGHRWPPPPHMYPPPPHWPHPGYPLPPPYPPPHAYPMYAPPPYPPPPHHWTMYGPPPPPFPASSVGERKKTKLARASPETTTEAAAREDASSSLGRCVPLQQPVPKRLWSPTNAERRLPDFAQLINFPDKGGGKGAKSSNGGTKQCVMCGKFRRSSAGSGSVAGRRVKTDPAAAEGPLHETAQIIPRQNKGVCTVCDVAVWVVQGQDLEIKWCKGCKNFRPWAAFGDKGLATKCVRCRKRQKEKYATQKISLGTSRAGQLLLNLAPRGGTAVPTSAGSIRKRTTAPSSVLPE